jgi:translation initiation factor 2D
MSAMRGRGIAILHIFKDNLWMLGDQSLQPPFIEKIKLIANENQDVGESKEANNEETESLEKLKLEEKPEEVENEAIQQQHSDESEEMKLDDELLKTIFFAALKYKSKEMKLPLIVSTFTKILQDCRYLLLEKFLLK